ncbi:hypothetical protein SPHINGOR109_10174 [Sphingorhabdus sp. 109]|nr:hypothetical protein SPHINGOR109_10174 [Sphingorhabdus sp. 109]
MAMGSPPLSCGRCCAVSDGALCWRPAPRRTVARDSVDIGYDPHDQIVAQPHEQGIIAGPHPDIAARRCRQLAVLAIVDPPVIRRLGANEPLALRETMAGAGGFRGRSRGATAAGVAAAGLAVAGLVASGLAVVAGLLAALPAILGAVALRVLAVVVALVLLLGQRAGGGQKRQGAQGGDRLFHKYVLLLGVVTGS